MRAAGDETETKSHRRRKPPAAVHGLLVVALAVVLALALSTGSSANSAQAGASASSAAAATEVIALRAKANNKYVTANAGTSPLIANRTSAGTWEKFDLVRINSTDVYLRAHANGKYVSAEAAGAAALISNRAAAGPWEKFQLINNSDGTKSLRARVNNKLVVAESAGAAPLIANRTAIGPWEKFDFVKMSSASQATPPNPTNPTSAPVVAPGTWPNSNNTGVPAGWSPSRTVTGSYTVSTPGAVLQDLRIVDGDLIINAQNVRIRRVEVKGGSIRNFTGQTCQKGLIIEDTTIGRGSRPTTGDYPAIETGGYTAQRVKIDGLSEGFRVGGKGSCGGVAIYNSYARVQSPDVCGDWHGDGLQGYDGGALTLRNTTLIMVERAGCGGTAPFFYPDGQGNTTVDIDGLIVQGGGYPFRLGTAGSVVNLKIVDRSWGYGPADVKCSLLSRWSASLVSLDSNGQPKQLRALSCS